MNTETKVHGLNRSNWLKRGRDSEKVNTEVDARQHPDRASVIGGGNQETLWTREEVQKFLNVEPQMVYVYVKDWGLKPQAVIGTNYLWSKEFVEKWAETNQYRRISTRLNTSDTIPTGELRKRLSVSRETLHLLVGMGMEPAINHGRFYRWKYDDVLVWLAENRPTILERMKLRQELAAKEGQTEE